MTDLITLLTAAIYVFGLGCVSFILARGFIFSDLKYTFVKLIRRGKLETYITEFLYCPMCIGFWIGIAGEFYSGILTGIYGKIGYLLMGAITAVFALIVERIVTRPEE